MRYVRLRRRHIAADTIDLGGLLPAAVQLAKRAPSGFVLTLVLRKHLGRRHGIFTSLPLIRSCSRRANLLWFPSSAQSPGDGTREKCANYE